MTKNVQNVRNHSSWGMDVVKFLAVSLTMIMVVLHVIVDFSLIIRISAKKCWLDVFDIREEDALIVNHILSLKEANVWFKDVNKCLEFHAYHAKKKNISYWMMGVASWKIASSGKMGSADLAKKATTHLRDNA